MPWEVAKPRRKAEEELMKLFLKKDGWTWGELVGEKIRSPATLIKILKDMEKKKLITSDKDPEDRRITIYRGVKDKVEVEFFKSALKTTIDQSETMDSYFNWTTEERPREISSSYIFIETEKNAEPGVIRVPHKRLEHQEPWLFNILECAEEMNLVKREELVNMTETKLREIWNKIFRGTRRITIVETLNPQLLLEESLRAFSVNLESPSKS